MRSSTSTLWITWKSLLCYTHVLYILVHVNVHYCLQSWTLDDDRSYGLQHVVVPPEQAPCHRQPAWNANKENGTAGDVVLPAPRRQQPAWNADEENVTAGDVVLQYLPPVPIPHPWRPAQNADRKNKVDNGGWVSSFLTAHQHILGRLFSALQWCGVDNGELPPVQTVITTVTMAKILQVQRITSVSVCYRMHVWYYYVSRRFLLAGSSRLRNTETDDRPSAAKQSRTQCWWPT